MALESTLEERPSELLRHPGDVVAAAITIQRFFRRLKENNELKKMKKREMKRRTTTSDESSSSEEEEQTETRDSESDSLSGSEDTASDSSVTESRSETTPSSLSRESPPSQRRVFVLFCLRDAADPDSAQLWSRFMNLGRCQAGPERPRIDDVNSRQLEELNFSSIA